jgi:hypothetical protein
VLKTFGIYKIDGKLNRIMIHRNINKKQTKQTFETKLQHQETWSERICLNNDELILDHKEIIIKIKAGNDKKSKQIYINSNNGNTTSTGTTYNHMREQIITATNQAEKIQITTTTEQWVYPIEDHGGRTKYIEIGPERAAIAIMMYKMMIIDVTSLNTDGVIRCATYTNNLGTDNSVKYLGIPINFEDQQGEEAQKKIISIFTNKVRIASELSDNPREAQRNVKNTLSYIDFLVSSITLNPNTIHQMRKQIIKLAFNSIGIANYKDMPKKTIVMSDHNNNIGWNFLDPAEVQHKHIQSIMLRRSSNNEETKKALLIEILTIFNKDGTIKQQEEVNVTNRRIYRQLIAPRRIGIVLHAGGQESEQEEEAQGKKEIENKWLHNHSQIALIPERIIIIPSTENNRIQQKEVLSQFLQLNHGDIIHTDSNKYKKDEVIIGSKDIFSGIAMAARQQYKYIFMLDLPENEDSQDSTQPAVIITPLCKQEERKRAGIKKDSASDKINAIQQTVLIKGSNRHLKNNILTSFSIENMNIEMSEKQDPNNNKTWNRRQLVTQLKVEHIEKIARFTKIAISKLTQKRKRNGDKTMLWPSERNSEYHIGIDASVKSETKRAPEMIIHNYKKRILEQQQQQQQNETRKERRLYTYKKDIEDIMVNTEQNDTINAYYAWVYHKDGYETNPYPSEREHRNNRPRWILCEVRRNIKGKFKTVPMIYNIHVPDQTKPSSTQITPEHNKQDKIYTETNIGIGTIITSGYVGGGSTAPLVCGCL